MSEDRCRVGIVAIIENQEEEFLIEKRTVDAEEASTWSFVAGGKKAGENVLDAAKREVREEVDAEFQPEKIIGVVDHETQREDDLSWTVIWIKGSIDGEPINAEPQKRENIEWKQEIPDNLHPTTEMMLETWRNENLHIEL